VDLSAEAEQRNASEEKDSIEQEEEEDQLSFEDVRAQEEIEDKEKESSLADKDEDDFRDDISEASQKSLGEKSQKSNQNAMRDEQTSFQYNDPMQAMLSDDLIPKSNLKPRGSEGGGDLSGNNLGKNIFANRRDPKD